MGAPFSVTLERRFSDIDSQGHVNNVVYFDYLQDARVALLFDVWHAAMKDAAQVVVRAEIDYRRPLTLKREPVTVEVWVTRIGGSSYTLSYRVLDDDGSLAAEAVTVLATVDPATGKAIRLPESLRTVLEGLRPDEQA